ncbi:SDR family NAD(P)-dependent oxidoreductase [Cryptosporangium aurantiacum]|uniref:NAD(P)-dependent dehydrogenase, short-chain alcohol dehydrogenase family n=1 Tax=Cryptosporangium aurantiacum TaxID=134849 RepID=A0A1M7PGE4_9ACTN|nr:SDR family NAD(P)-dependent oxidoreductase [Cryptosporangium aurantiacum]SHN16155.1 NAD(P)-dependent dehydrogenase, short-chain alcohol dehydrogenase family [Cryptosporangium aurantiacum]
MRDERLLDGRVVIVTGGGRGIGRAHCLELAAHGAIVMVNDLGVGVRGEAGADSPADEVVAEIVEKGGTAIADGSSVTDWNAVSGLVARAVDQFGRLDGVVNNAGILRDATITSLTEADWDAVIDVHLKGTFALTKHACDYWRSESKAGRPVAGRIVNTTSGTGLAGNVGQAAYGAAKAAIANLTLTTAMEGTRYGVTANAISPVASTRMTAGTGLAAAADGGFDPFDPGNSSPVVAWLLSAASGWLTGRILRVDGNSVLPVEPWSVRPGHAGRPGQRVDAAELDAAMRVVLGTAPAGLAGLRLR